MKIALCRGAGIGDVLCLTSALPGLKELYPNAHITFGSTPASMDIVRGNPLIDEYMYMHEMNADSYDKYLEPDHGLEWNDWIPRVQCRMLGVPFNPPQLYLTPEELAAAPVYDVAVCHWATHDQRRYEPMKELIRCLLRQEVSVVQADNGPSLGIDQPQTDIRQAAAIVAKAKVLLTVDTSLMHVGVALDKKMVVIFGDLTGPHNQYVPNSILAHAAVQPDRIANMVLCQLGRLEFDAKWKSTDAGGNVCTSPNSLPK
jgi:ADP-heptose:LPS heptosyltransferase